MNKKEIEIVLSPKGLAGNAIFQEAKSGLSVPEMRSITEAMNDNMTMQERSDFRLMIAISQNVGRLKATEKKEKDDKTGKEKKEPKIEPLNLGTKILKRYVVHFSESGTCNIEKMAEQMKMDLENLPEPFKVLMPKVKKMVADKSDAVLEGFGNLKKKLEPYLKREKKFGSSFFANIKKGYNERKK
ncbi:hypothetical protein ACFL23_01535 [Patescibacteria group bacterium]